MQRFETASRFSFHPSNVKTYGVTTARDITAEHSAICERDQDGLVLEISAMQRPGAVDQIPHGGQPTKRA